MLISAQCLELSCKGHADIVATTAGLFGLRMAMTITDTGNQALFHDTA